MEENLIKNKRFETKLYLLINFLEILFLLGNYHHMAAADDTNWIPYLEFEYFVSSTSEETSLTWHEARSWCMTRSADLASILSSDEQYFILDQINITGYEGPVWTGLNIFLTSNWSWTDNEEFVFEAWAEGFPADDPIMPWKCAFSEFDGTWKNAHCDTIRGFVCKRRGDVVTTPKTDPPTQPVPGYCPGDFVGVANSNKCFLMVKQDDGTGLTWDEAAAMCRMEYGLNPDLASISNAAENAVLVALLESHNFGLWIGLRGEGSLDSFKWSDNSELSFLNWAPNEPQGSTDHCVELYVTPGPPGTWNNLNCTRKRGFICQTYKNPDATVVTPGSTTVNPCPSGYVSYWYACYKLSDQQKTWPDAEATCIQDGGHLTSVHSDSENSAMIVYLSSKGVTSFVWIGLEYLKNESVYYWTDKWHVTYTEWGSGQPNRTADGGCVGTDGQGKWSDAICSEQHLFLCKITTAPPKTTPAQAEGTCPKNVYPYTWHPYGEYCYAASSDYTTSNWEMAKQNCLNADPHRSSNLVSIHEQFENKFVADLVRQYSLHYGESFWIGMEKEGMGSSFKWIDNTEVEYTNWTPGEPNDVNGSQNCARIYHKNYPDSWDDYICSQYLPYVCKARKAPLPSTPPAPSSVEGICPDINWQPYGGLCFLFRPDMYVTWDEADIDCKAFGAHLVTIWNKDENWFVHRRLLEASALSFDRQHWIGLTKETDDLDYMWVNDYPLGHTNYTNWKSGSPSQNKTRLCVDLYGSEEEDMVNGGRWTTSQCDKRNGYACQIPKAMPPDPNQDTSGTDVGAIVGIVFGVIAGIALIAGLSYFGYRWYKNRNKDTAPKTGRDNSQYDYSSESGSQANYFGDLENQDLSSVKIGRLQLNDDE